MSEKVIKGKGAQPHLSAPLTKGGIVRQRVLSATADAEKILHEAAEEAERIRTEAHQIRAEVEAVRDEARRKGYAEGEAKGLAQVSEQLIELHRLKEKFYQEAEPEVLKLVLSIAEKVVGDLVYKEADAVKHVVRQSLEKAIGENIMIRVNPEDYKTIMSEEHTFREMVDRTKRIVWKEDETISKGGCIVETEVGTIDARIETQLEAIKKALR